MAVGSFLLGGALLYQGYQENKKAKAASEQARATEQRRAGAEAARNARKAREQARIQRADLLSAAVQSGGGTSSSSVSGSQGSVSTSTAEAIGFSQQQLGYANAIAGFQSTANRRAGRAATFNQLGMFAIGNAGGAQKAYEAIR